MRANGVGNEVWEKCMSMVGGDWCGKNEGKMRNF
jgi:hypothetical protein